MDVIVHAADTGVNCSLPRIVDDSGIVVERLFLAELRHTMLSRRSGEPVPSERHISTHSGLWRFR